MKVTLYLLSVIFLVVAAITESRRSSGRPPAATRPANPSGRSAAGRGTTIVDALTGNQARLPEAETPGGLTSQELHALKFVGVDMKLLEHPIRMLPLSLPTPGGDKLTNEARISLQLDTAEAARIEATLAEYRRRLVGLLEDSYVARKTESGVDLEFAVPSDVLSGIEEELRIALDRQMDDASAERFRHLARGALVGGFFSFTPAQVTVRITKDAGGDYTVETSSASPERRVRYSNRGKAVSILGQFYAKGALATMPEIASDAEAFKRGVRGK